MEVEPTSFPFSCFSPSLLCFQNLSLCLSTCAQLTLYYHACKYGTASILNYALYSTGTVYLRLTIVNTTVILTSLLVSLGLEV
jgi:hypothetical protein